MPCIMIDYFNCIIIFNGHFLTFSYDWVSFTFIYKKIIKILMTFLIFNTMQVNIKILIILILVTDFCSSCSMLNKGFLFPNISSSSILDWISQPKGTLLTSKTFKIKNKSLISKERWVRYAILSILTILSLPTLIWFIFL